MRQKLGFAFSVVFFKLNSGQHTSDLRFAHVFAVLIATWS